jgi:hypothetical protein
MFNSNYYQLKVLSLPNGGHLVWGATRVVRGSGSAVLQQPRRQPCGVGHHAALALCHEFLVPNERRNGRTIFMHYMHALYACTLDNYELRRVR